MQDTFAERDDAVSVVGGLGSVEQKLACHPEMDNKRPAIELHEDELTSAPDAFNRATREILRQGCAITRRDEFRRESRGDDGASDQMRRERSDYGFDFR